MSETSTQRTAVFVRLPTPVAERLDSWAKVSGRSKQDLVAQLIETTDDRPDAPAERPTAPDDVFDLSGVAAYLRVDPDDVMARIADGDFPARRFGTEWRCSRAAVDIWLAGTDPVSDRRTGFASGPSG